MTTTLLRAGTLSCALLATTCLTAPAAAQSLPSVYQHVDQYGVDLVDGSFNFSLAEGSIGSGEGALTLVRSFGAGGERDNLSVDFQRTVTGSTVEFVLTFGNRTETFSGAASATSFDSNQGNGATLTKVAADQYRYVAADGAVTTYGPPDLTYTFVNSDFCLAGSELDCRLIAVHTVRPNGHRTDYEWDAGEDCRDIGPPNEPIIVCDGYWRQRGMRNSFGYAVRFSFQQESNPITGVPGANWYKRTGAVLSNGAVQDAPIRMVSYSTSGTVTSVTTPGGEIWRLTRDSSQRLTGVRGPTSNPSATDDIGVSYATAGHVSSVTANGVTMNYNRSSSGPENVMTRTDPNSATLTATTYTGFARPSIITDEVGRTTSFNYDSVDRLTGVWLPELNAIFYQYDSRGNVTEVRRAAKQGSGLLDRVTSASYPATCATPATCNLPTSTTDERSNTTDYAYSSTHGGILSVTAPAPGGGITVRPQTRYSYTLTNGEYLLTATSACASGDATSGCVGTAGESRTELGYDVNGNVSSLTRRAGNSSVVATSAMSYDSHGNLLTVDGPLTGTADTVRFRYDSAGRQVGTVSPDPDGAGSLKHPARRTTFDGRGLPVTIETGTVNSQSDGDWTSGFTSLERVEQAYDGNRRPIETRLIAGSTTYALSQTGYDSLGRVQCAAQRMNPNEYASAQPAACTPDTEGSFGPDRIARTSYDAAGRVTLVQSGYGITGVQANEVAMTYTTHGLVETVTDAEGNRTTYEYDGHQRLLNTRYPSPTADGVSAPTSGAGADFEQLGYDGAGNVTSFRRRSGATIAFSYDALNQMTLKDVPEAGGDVAFGYDLLSRQASAVYSATGLGVTSAHDALGRQISTTANLEGASRTYSFQYDPAGRRTRVAHPDGPYFDYAYDALNRMTTIKDNGGATLVTLAYDSAGRRDTISYANGVVTSYDFDPVGRLTSLAHNFAGTAQDVTFGYAYNPASQIQSRTISNDLYSFAQANSGTAYSANGRNQYTAVGGAAATHDANGNLTAEGGRTLGYDSENRLVSASSTAPGTTPITLAYDPQGRLRTLGLLSLTAVYDMVGTDMVALRFGTAAPTERHVFGPGVDEPMVTYNHSLGGARSFYHADGHGSIVALSDSGGAAPTRIAYDEYGRPNGVASRFFHAGKIYLATPAAYYNNARFYDPGLGRFLQSDPIGYGDGMNLYAYVGNDPVNSTDPSGTVERGFSVDAWTTTTFFIDKVSTWNVGYRGEVFIDKKYLGSYLSGTPAAMFGVGSLGGTGGPGRGAGDPMTWPHGQRPPAATCAGAIQQVTTMSRAAAYAGSPLEQAFLRRYAAGNTTPFRLSSATFQRAAGWINQRINSSQHVYNVSGDRGGSWSATINFGGSIQNEEFNFALGQATGYFQGDSLVGLRDNFDFSDRSYGEGIGGRLTRWGVGLARNTISSGCPNSNTAGFAVTGGVTQ